MKKFKGLLLMAMLILVDQITKLLAKTNLSDGDTISIIKGVFKLQYHENAGAVWGIMQNQIPLLVIVTLVILGIMGFFYFRVPDTKRFLPMKLITVFIAAGAVGNLIDRIVYHYVIDFLYFELIDFPVFNVADCYVTGSVFVMVILILFYYKDEEFDMIFKKTLSLKNSGAEEKNEDRK